jgi:hypothetical protein
VRGEQRRAAELAHDQVLGVVRVGEQQLVDGAVLETLGQPQRDAIVGPDGVQVEAEPLANGATDRQRPRRVHPTAERGQHAHPPVAELVAEALDHHGAIAGHRARGGFLLGQVGQQVAGRQLVQVVVGGERLERALLVETGHATAELAQGPAELDRPPGGVAVPERRLARLAGRGRDDHLLGRDALDAPGARAEDEGLAGSALVDHLFVELADARPALAQEHAVQAALGDRPAAGHRDHPRVAAGHHAARHAVPHQARLQIRELV